MTLKYDYTFEPGAANSTAASVADLALTGRTRVLDIGSGPGWVSRYLAAEHGREVTCLDNDPAALASLEEAGLRAFETDLEQEGWYAAVAGQSFDVVVLADVLEHLRDPGRLLRSLLSESLLAPEGLLVISIPNASHQSVIGELMLGDFRYTETGVLDETHIRWFTLRSLQRLLERSGFLVDRVMRTTRILESTPTGERATQIPEALRRGIKELNADTEVYQYVLRAVPDTAARRMAADREEFEEERRRWARERETFRRESLEARAEMERATALLREERAMFQDELQRGAKELSARNRRIERLTKRRDQLLSDLQQARDRLQGSLFEESRGVRMASRAVRTARAIRGRM